MNPQPVLVYRKEYRNMAKDTNQLDKQIQLEEDKQRTLPKNIMYFVMAISIVFVLWQLYVLFISPIDPLLLRTVHICFVLLLGFLYFPLSDKMRKDKVHFIDLILAAGALALMFYTISEYKGITLRSGVNPTQLDIFWSYIDSFYYRNGKKNDGYHASNYSDNILTVCTVWSKPARSFRSSEV